MRLLIQGALVDGAAKDILVDGDRITKVAPASADSAPASALPDGAEVIDARGMAALPSLVNAHAH